MKTLFKVALTLQVAAAVQVAYGIRNIKKASKLEVKTTTIDTITVEHEGSVFKIDVCHTNVLCNTTMPNALAKTEKALFSHEVRHSITIQDSLVGTDMYDAVLNHEIGHIVLGHTQSLSFLDNGLDIVKRELEADAYSVSKGHIEGMIKFRTLALKYSGLLPDYNQPCLLALLAKKVFN